jgi:hypothetical protein
MVNTKVIALVVMVALIGIGAATLTMPMIAEVSAQGNATGNQTGNYTDASAGSGNISGMMTTNP